MSFCESVFPAGFNQKITNEDLFVKGNYGIPPRNQRGKVPEDSRRLSTKGDHMSLTCGAAWPHCQAAQPLVGPPISLFATLVLHHLLECISAVYSSRFDPRVED
jgi:hypothetical protein